jgi:hypothetical protein
VQAFAAQFLSCCHLEGLIIGNITSSEALDLARSLRTTLSAQGQAGAGNSSSGSRECKLLAAADRLQEQCVSLPRGVALLHRAAARNPEEENCCVEAYYQVICYVWLLLAANALNYASGCALPSALHASLTLPLVCLGSEQAALWVHFLAWPGTLAAAS